MQTSNLAKRLLIDLFALQRERVAASRPRLERRLRVRRVELQASFDELTNLGLVDIARLRLTFAGLAVAVAWGAHKRTARRRAQCRAAPAKRCVPSALFSAREMPRAVA